MQIGAYPIERDYSHYVAYAAKTVFAVVGTATKGPIGVATVCTSAQDLVNKFGPLHSKCYGLYAGQYFLSQSSKLYFVRAASESATGSTVSISGVDAEGKEVSAITLSFIESGTYYDGYTVVVGKGIPKVIEGESIDTYKFAIKSKAGTTLETIDNILIEDIGTKFVSNYVSVTYMNPAVVALTEDVYTFTGGADGIEDISEADYINAAQVLASDTIDMNLFAVPGVSEAPVVTAMLALAESRGDCLYLVDPPAGLTKEGVAQWHNGAGEYQHTAFNSSYGALYYDWITIYDPINKTRVNVPPSVLVAASYAYSDRITEVWYAPAGLNRGIIRGALDSVTKLGKTDTEYLYTGDNSINAIYDDPQVGLVIWGQKTLLRADTALNRVNVRRMMNYLKRVITAACNYLTFEPNDRVTWNSFTLKILPVLKNIQAKRGIYEFRIIKGETIVTEEDIDNYKMPCMVMIRPTKSAEEIPIYFTITSTGADFNEVLEANGIITE